jgi:hypothetical protein
VGDNPESALILELRELARSSGDTFTLTRDGYEVQIAYVSGSSSSLTLRHGYDSAAKPFVAEGRAVPYRRSARGRALEGVRPMLIQLRPETTADRVGKEEGISREHQTGDADFDFIVYVDSPTVDEALLQAVLGPDVRAAVLELLALGVQKITLDDESRRVEAHLSSFADGREHDDRGERMVAAFARLLCALPEVRDSGGAHPADPFRVPLRVGGVLAGVAAFASIPAYFAIAEHYDCTEPSSDGDGADLKAGCGTPGLIALVLAFVVGSLVAIVTRKLLVPRISGRSSSASQLASTTLIAFFLAAQVAFYTASVLGLARH